MTAWIQQGFRLDIALAVAFEVATQYMQRAECPAEHRLAALFNGSLWRVAGKLAATAPLAEDRDGLARAATTMARLSVDEAVAVNTRFARVLAGRAATQGTLRQIMAEWRAARDGAPEAEFGQWLVARLDGYASAPVTALAA